MHESVAPRFVGTPFLNPWWADAVALGGLICTGIGTLATLIALYVAYQQIKRQVDATVAASRATQSVAEDIRRSRNAQSAANARRYFADLKRHVQAGAWDLTLVRLVDLREQLAQFQDDQLRVELQELLVNLGAYETLFRKSARKEVRLSDAAMHKWLVFSEAMSSSLDRLGVPAEPVSQRLT